MSKSAEEEQRQWLEGKETTFTNALLCTRPGSSGWSCLLDSAVVLLPQEVLRGRLLQSPT